MLFYVLNSIIFLHYFNITPEEVKRNKFYFLIFLIAIDVWKSQIPNTYPLLKKYKPHMKWVLLFAPFCRRRDTKELGHC